MAQLSGVGGVCHVKALVLARCLVSGTPPLEESIRAGDSHAQFAGRFQSGFEVGLANRPYYEVGADRVDLSQPGEKILGPRRPTGFGGNSCLGQVKNGLAEDKCGGFGIAVRKIVGILEHRCRPVDAAIWRHGYMRRFLNNRPCFGHQLCRDLIGVEEDQAGGEHVCRHRPSILRFLSEVSQNAIGMVDENFGRHPTVPGLDPLAEGLTVKDVNVQVAASVRRTAKDGPADDDREHTIFAKCGGDARSERFVVGRA